MNNTFKHESKMRCKMAALSKYTLLLWLPTKLCLCFLYVACLFLLVLATEKRLSHPPSTDKIRCLAESSFQTLLQNRPNLQKSSYKPPSGMCIDSGSLRKLSRYEMQSFVSMAYSSLQVAWCILLLCIVGLIMTSFQWEVFCYWSDLCHTAIP